MWVESAVEKSLRYFREHHFTNEAIASFNAETSMYATLRRSCMSSTDYDIMVQLLNYTAVYLPASELLFLCRTVSTMMPYNHVLESRCSYAKMSIILEPMYDCKCLR